MQPHQRICTFFLSLAVSLAVGCATPGNEASAIRKAIEASLSRTVRATQDKNIDAYMEELPPDLRIYDNSGREVTRDQQRADVLRDWSVIARTISLSHTVDSLEIRGDSVLVSTSQRWERMMLRRDGSGQDLIVTTRKHKEVWKKFQGRWLGYDIEELEGELFINGEKAER
jgi:hypothetical protein